MPFCGTARQSRLNVRLGQLPVSLGGLEVINPAEKATALQLRWVPRIGDPTYEAKWVFLVFYWIGFALSSRVKSWSFLRCNLCPKYLGVLRHGISKTFLQQSIDYISISPYCLTTKSKLSTRNSRSLRPSGCTAHSLGKNG